MGVPFPGLFVVFYFILFYFIYFIVVTVIVIAILLFFILLYGLYARVSLVRFHASGMGKGLVGYILLIGCLIPHVAGVPFALGVLPPASSVSAVPIFTGASPSQVVTGPSGSSGTSLLPTTQLPPVSSGVTPSLLVPPQGLPSQSGLSLSPQDWCRGFGGATL